MCTPRRANFYSHSMYIEEGVKDSTFLKRVNKVVVVRPHSRAFDEAVFLHVLLASRSRGD